ncbi:MAG: hypothetical protein ACXIUM_10710 [Wenzhouxiangella sp.]
MNKFFLLLAALLPVMAQALDRPFDAGRLDYSVQFNGKRVDWHTFAFYLLPGQSEEIRVIGAETQPVAIDISGGELEAIGPGHWRFRAPETPGLYPIRIAPAGRSPMTLQVLTQVPLEEKADGWLNGYRIGQYPDRPLRDNPIYLAPPGKIEVTQELMDLPVSPNFTLGQFVGKQQPEHWPKYMILREGLIAKLELILAEVNARGIRANTFAILSGHRTPWYNNAIGNGLFSRHVWGGAADIFIDNSGNGRMDDLNGDGQVDVGDAQLLIDIIEDMYRDGRFGELQGGLGLYGPRPHRGPFVHVDARGHEARWAFP